MASIFGYFDAPEQTTPAFDPGLDAKCPVCGKTVGRVNIKTISVMLRGDMRSYFYRVHKACYDPLTAEQQADVDGLIIDAVARTKDVN